MTLRHTEEQREIFAKALQSIGAEDPLSVDEVDALSVLEDGDLDAFGQVWRRLPAGARARLIRGLHNAAEQRLRLDFSALNRLALEDDDAQVRLAGVQSTIEDRSQALFSRLLRILRDDPEGQVRAAAAEDLARFTLLAELEDLDPEAVPRLRAALFDAVHDEAEEQRVRDAALAALGYFSDDEVAQELGQSFITPAVRLGAVRGMGRTADPRWTDRLMPVLGSDDPRMREAAARALGEIEDERAVTPLVEVIDDPEQVVRLAVIEALGHIGGEDAREALLYVAEAAEEVVGKAAERALGELEEDENDPLDV